MDKSITIAWHVSHFLGDRSELWPSIYSPGAGADNPKGQNCDVNRNLLSLRSFATSFKNISLKSDFKQFFMILYMYIAPGQGLTTPWGQNVYVNRNILSFRSFVAK